jgi:hypothetical protein
MLQYVPGLFCKLFTDLGYTALGAVGLYHLCIGKRLCIGET